MRAFKRSRIALPLISIVAGFALSAQAQEPQHKPPPQGQAVRQGPPRPGQGPAMHGPQGQHVVHGNFPVRNSCLQQFHGHFDSRTKWPTPLRTVYAALRDFD